ncbi:hypothetical protein CK203_047651 [Vitis vinifera]|uniref:Retrovirus-related Pol polyprotein from transposon RE1 n=1 Tax=Vitis vinifera TaxID=29760 RepID=A0A438H5I1_VITVI|nr:hypothetical protein CK203_047651 [Vitis vinifera]
MGVKGSERRPWGVSWKWQCGCKENGRRMGEDPCLTKNSRLMLLVTVATTTAITWCLLGGSSNGDIIIHWCNTTATADTDRSNLSLVATLIHYNTTIPNPDYIFWIHQDHLILNALIGSLSLTIIPFIAQATTSHEAWNILANTYAKPSRGRIKQDLRTGTPLLTGKAKDVATPQQSLSDAPSPTSFPNLLPEPVAQHPLEQLPPPTNPPVTH